MPIRLAILFPVITVGAAIRYMYCINYGNESLRTRHIINLSCFASQSMNIVSVCFTHLHFNPVFRMHALMSRQTEDLVFDFNCNTHIYGYTLQILPL